MSEVTYYVALPFVAADDGVEPGEAVECFNPNSAVMTAEALSRKPGYVGALAFSRTGDPATGDFVQGDPQVRRRSRRSERTLKLDRVRHDIVHFWSPQGAT
jgi:hypothetical protein